MSTIRRIGLADLERLLADWQPRRTITAFHLHCTWRPRRADFRGIATIEAMRTFHLSQGWSDIAQHLSIDPAGGLWTGRSWDAAPASARGHNGSSTAGPFMIEVIGDFDKGQDPFDGAQRQATLGVIVAVLRRFGLDEKALFFHRDFTNAKTCPGTSLDRAAIRKEIAALLAGTQALDLPAASDATLADGEARGFFAAGARGGDGDPTDPDFAEVPEAEWMLAQQEFIAEGLDRAGAGARAPLPANEPLRRHVVNLSKGLLSKTGDIDSTTVTPRMLVEKHLVDYLETCRLQKKPAHLVFYAHGGLVDEASAVCYARTVLPWWQRNGVFPIFFIWESGLFETLRKSPRGAARGWFGDLTDRLLEGLTQAAARRVWAQMKEDAGNASAPALAQFDGQSGGAYQLAQLLRPVLAKYPEAQLHAIGHSTGPIFLAKFLPLLTAHGHVVDTLSYLAPAIRTDRFVADVLPLLGVKKPIRELCLYTMTDAAEQADTCMKVYRKSLLYFVREACEDRDDGRVLGLQRDLYADAALRKLFGLPAADDGRISSAAGVAAIEFSPAPGAPAMNPLTRALQHGGFDNDAGTMVSVLARILGVPRSVGSVAMQFPNPAAFKVCGLDDATRAAPLDDDAASAVGACPCCGSTRGRDDVAGDDGRDGFGDDDFAAADADATPPRAEPKPPAPPRGDRAARRIAVCIGIDAYRDMPLAGCVSDSRRWGEALARQRFEVRALTDAQATREAMHKALARLVGEAVPGDELVFQFSGHGAQIKDVSGDEGDGIDEVFVPFDYHEGQMLIDDDLHEITRTLAPGATLTLFMDCCHSGSNSRAKRPRAAAGGDRPRLLVFDAETVAKFVAARGGSAVVAPTSARAGARGAGSVDLGPGPGVVHFAACADREYAWESNGEGDFTRAALGVFADALAKGWSNQKFIDAAIRALGAEPRQHPRLWKPAAGLAARALLAGR